MDYGGESQKVEGPWIPATPDKAVLPKPQVIYTDFLGNQLGPANGLQSEEFLFGLTPEARAEYANLCCNRTNCNWEAALDAKACSSSIGYFEASKQFSFSNLIGDANNVSCSSLLALAEAANDASGASKQFTDTNSHKEPNWASALTYAASMSASAFAPVTPAKATGVDCNELTETPYLCLDERTDHERNKQIELEAAVIDTIVLQADKKIQNPATDSASTAISATYKENTGDLIDINKTPQQKPRKKKHRPKVIIEGKPKKTSKPVTPKPPASEEKPAVKRKYVRRNTLNKAPATPQTEANGQFNDPKMQELPRKSSRRALNFDIGRQTREEAPRCNRTSDLDADQQKQASVTGNQPKSTVHLGHGIELFVENSQATSDLDAGQQKQASFSGNQPKSTVHLGQGIEVFVENSQAGIAYDFNRTVNQMLKDYITLPEKQVPSTPIPAQTDPKEANSTGKEGVTAHYVKESTIQIMLQASSQLSPTIQNGCTYSTSTMSTEVGLAKGLKRKTSGVNEPPDTCSTNLLGFQYNALPTYQILSLAQFPGFCKKKRSEKGQGSVTSSIPSLVTAAGNKQMLQTTRYFPSIRDPSSSRVNYCFPVPECSPCGFQGARREENGSPHHKQQILSCIMSQTDRSTKKRSRGHTRVGDLASLSRLVGCMRDPTNPARRVQVNCNGQQIGTQPPKTVEEEVAKMCPKTTTKKRTVKRNTVASALSCSNEGQSNGRIVLFKHNMYSGKLLGTSYGNFSFRPGTSPETISQLVDAITKQLKNLDINRNNSAALVLYGRDHMNSTSSNALIPYGRDGTVIPFDGSFEFIKKRPPRPKVDLDEETTRVWKLLLENINNEGIDGTDDEKAKWWEEERRVFRGRTESFIARMHLVQGDRRFSPWKGSVVDSVVGVFLTQNVSDHLSSSAFMSLASHFPFKSESKYEPCHEEKGSSEIREPIVSISDPEENVTWTLEMSNTTICDQSSMNRRGVELDEEREVVNSNESPGSSTGISSIETGLEAYYESTANKSTIEKGETIKVCYIDEERTAINDALSSQNSVVSSQNSEDSPLPETAERKGSCLENNAELDNMAGGSSLKKLNGTFSFMELLQNVGQRNGKTSPDHNSKGECCKTQSEGNDFQRRNADCLDCCTILSGLPVASNLKDLEGGCVEMITAGTRYSSTTKKVENNMKDHSAPVGEYSGQIAQQNKSAAESAGQLTVENKVTKSVQEASRSPTSNNSSCNSVQGGHLTRQFQSTLIEEFERSLAQEQNTEVLQNLSGEIIHPVESTSGYDRQGKNPQKMTESDLVEHASQMKELDAKRKAKSRRVGRELKDNVNWDALRKEAEADGRKREKTKNTMDSLDWEAVRCADVNEIANTIKERGMNNMLAERIKAFLNRLVREHGSIDLEWLRDVPPDEAKEYLLSIRGLGLKSVECVRLLTLHHLAFPVDTNVGRIAVRLGWVPLQPLPESLQLHLLELYPVLESIQKYLWPRLCKLDQRTLYELHYQMITFGKVFCTKSKPNCNACPMRGECRHFASAFASARLALPGPEEKSIVGVAANRTTGQTPPIMTNPLPLPPSLPPVTKESGKNQLTEAYQVSVPKWQDHNCEPIIEVPLSPEPELTQVTEIDIEDTFCEDPDEIPTIKLNIEQFTQNVQSYMQHNMDLQEHEMSKALVALTAEAASIPTPKLKNVSRLRTEHQVYELPDSHPLLQGLEQREPDDPCSYLLAIWTPGETANSIQPPSAEGMCTSQQEGKFCCEKTCFSCNSIREENSQIVRGTLLIPCRTAMRGSFPLNGTYFQVNEVFADHDSSQNPIEVPRAWIWNLQRRTVYFGTSVPTIFKGLTTEEIQHCFWRGFVCVRGFDQKTRAPRPLIARLHFPASKLKANRTAGEEADDEQAK